MEFWKLNLKKIGILKIVWELKFWKLSKNWSCENYLKIEVFENYLKIEVLKNKYGNWSFENWNLEIEVLKMIWTLKY